MKKLFIIFINIIISTITIAQVVPYGTDNNELYNFIDELANIGYIEVNSAVKPYSRMQIANMLQSVNPEKLNKRQQDELNFYLKDFNKEIYSNKKFDKRFDLFYYADSTFKLSANIILGGRGFYNSNGFEHHRWNGGKFFGYIGKHIGFYGYLCDNYESTIMGTPKHITKHNGAVYKLGSNKKDYSDTRGGISYSWKTGSISLIKDKFIWGNNYNGANIFSAQNPSIAHFKFHLKPINWLDINYMHGWLASEIIDKNRSYELYEDTRVVYKNKFIAASIFTVTPWKKIHVSLGNSIIYSDGNVNPVFFIPFVFYKSADHTYNGSHNASGYNTQMFFDFNCRKINKTHLYTSVFIDELSIKNAFNKDKQSNFISLKIGTKVSNIINNFSVTCEYTRNNPFVYTHFIPSLKFTSNNYNMGSYLHDNSDEIFFAIGYKPIKGLNIELSYTGIRKGANVEEELEKNNKITALWKDERKGTPFMEEVRYSRNSFKLKATYQIINDAYFFIEAEKYNLSGDDINIYSPAMYINDNKMLSFGVNFGF